MKILLPTQTAALVAGGLLLAAGLAPGPVGAAERIVLEPRYREGDAYTLSLATRTRTEARTAGAERPSVQEDVRLVYRAAVTVLAVDDAGRALRERHEGVRVTYERPDGSGSLFARDVAYEVRREEGAWRPVRKGAQLHPRAAEIVTGLLAERFAETLEPALADPGRAVAVGESWELDPSRVRRLLRRRGVRALELDEPATATLRRVPGAPEAGPDAGRLEIVYRIPIPWSELEEMPANARTARSEAHLEGRILLSEGAPVRPLARTAHLELDLSGVTPAAGSIRPGAWALHSVRRWEERMEPVVPASRAPGGAGAPRRPAD